MSTPTDPYNSNSRRPFDDEDSILEPLDDRAAAPAAEPGKAEPTLGSFANDGLPHRFTGSVEPEFPAHNEAGTEETWEADPLAPGRDEGNGWPSDAPAKGAEPTEGGAPAKDATPAEGWAEGWAEGPAADSTEGRADGPARADSPASTDSDSSPRGFGPLSSETSDDLASSTHDAPRGPTRTSVMSAATFGDSYEPYASSPASPDTAVEQPTPDSPAAPAFMTAASSADAEERRERWSADPGDTVLADRIPDAPKGRGLTHTGALLLTLLLVPAAWYLIADAGARLAIVPDNPWMTGSPQLMPLLELAGGVVVAGIIWWMARASSLGANVIGTLVLLAGAGALGAPKFAQDVVEQLSNAIGGYNAFTGNVVYHLGNDLATGRIAVFGALLLLTGIVSHGARRRGQAFGTTVTRRNLLLRDS
ncbi:hypothetical protein [Trueperella bernardiae]|uniref:hypothetical protein n=1 Tax=Trueperella bernardiae TaxID=59561 RepID=UPI0023F36AE6|nr:hypothetical protein [Trueperella bernardiae]